MLEFPKRYITLPCLIWLWLGLSGFRVACPIFCTEQTIVQEDYTADYNDCSTKADNQLAQEAGAQPKGEREMKAKLVALFSNCMNAKGWAVPGGSNEKNEKAEKKAVAAAPAPAAEPAPPPPAPVIQRKPDTPWAKRNAECAFARKNADVTVLSHKRAVDCDRECEIMRQKTNSNGPRKPAACP